MSCNPPLQVVPASNGRVPAGFPTRNQLQARNTSIEPEPACVQEPQQKTVVPGGSRWFQPGSGTIPHSN